MTRLRIGGFEHASYCQRCVWATHPDMLTGYCLRACTCDRCGEVADLAMVRYPVALWLSEGEIRAEVNEDREPHQPIDPMGAPWS